MDYIIEFIGIIMIVAGTGNTPYRALVPASVEGETFCNGAVKVPKHRAYIRVANGAIDNGAKWPAADQEPCTTTDETCTLFEIPVASNLKIEAGFTPSSGSSVHEHASYCLVPQLGMEMGKEDLALKAGADDLTIVSLDLPGGDLTARQYANESVISSLLVPAPPGTKSQTITITATSRADSNVVRSLVVKAGSTISLVYATKEMAVKSRDAKNPHMDPNHAHFFLFNRLLTTEICDRFPPRVRPCPPSVTQVEHKGGVVGDFVCSNTGCCKPKP